MFTSPVQEHKPKQTKTTVKKRTTKKPAVLTSVTKKLDNKELKRALARRALARAPQNGFDLAVPQQFSMRELLSRDNTDPRVSFGAHTLSPFVINLKDAVPEPMEILEQGARIRLNFNHPALTRKQKSTQEPKDALVLNQDDIFWQIRGDVTRSKPEQWLVQKPKQKRIDKTREIFATTLNIPNQPQISGETFEPKHAPEDIFSYFDLPEKEEDDTEESELVELTDNQELRGLKPAATIFSGLLRPVAAFVGISFVFVLPLHAMNFVGTIRQTKTTVTARSEQALSSLGYNLNADAFSNARERFSEAQESVSELGLGMSLMISAIPKANKNLKSAEAMLEAGEHLSVAGSRLAQAVTAIGMETNPTPVSHIRLLSSYLKSAMPHLNKAASALAVVEANDIPDPHKQTFTQIQNRLPALMETLLQFDRLSDVAINILGDEETKRYLLIFQNNTELRPTGGFMGSFAELKVRDGVMENLSVPGGGTYDLQGQLRRSRVAPSPLRLLNARWEFQDANWFADFPTSARQIIELYRDAGGPSVDGVIAVNATYIADLIALLGPIEMPEYDRIIDAENFLFETQKIVEVEYDRVQNRPKQFIGDLAPKLIERALTGEPTQFLALIDALSEGLSRKDVQMYFQDEQTQRVILDERWGGALTQTNGDYLMVVDTNLGGGKTDGVIKEDIDVDVRINKDGSIINTVQITRTHTGIKGALFTGVNNVDYMRLYVPRGSELLEAGGFDIPDETLFENPKEDWIFDDDLQFAAATHTTHEASQTDIYEENGKTVFGNWVQTSASETSVVTFRYRLPNRLFEDQKVSPYSLTLQKQSGIINRQTRVSIEIPALTSVVWKAQDLTDIIFDNETDALFALLLKAD